MNDLLTHLGNTGLGLTAFSAIFTSVLLRHGIDFIHRTTPFADSERDNFSLSDTRPTEHRVFTESTVSTGINDPEATHHIYAMTIKPGWTYVIEHSEASGLSRLIVSRDSHVLSIFQAPIAPDACSVQKKGVSTIVTRDNHTLIPSEPAVVSLDTLSMAICMQANGGTQNITPYGFIYYEMPHAVNAELLDQMNEMLSTLEYRE